jgi:methionyl-tRNA synthetase
MVARNCEGRVPAPGALTAADGAILAEAYAIGEKARAAMQDYALHQVLAEIWQVVAQANRYFAAEEPWAKRTSDPARMATILYVTAEVLRVIAIFVQPFMPAKMDELLDLLAVPADARRFGKATADHRLAAETTLPAPAPIFPRYVEPEEGQRAQG